MFSLFIFCHRSHLGKTQEVFVLKRPLGNREDILDWLKGLLEQLRPFMQCQPEKWFYGGEGGTRNSTRRRFLIMCCLVPTQAIIRGRRKTVLITGTSSAFTADYYCRSLCCLPRLKHCRMQTTLTSPEPGPLSASSSSAMQHSQFWQQGLKPRWDF